MSAIAVSANTLASGFLFQAMGRLWPFSLFRDGGRSAMEFRAKTKPAELMSERPLPRHPLNPP
jgi:hypothetical protein